MRVQDLIDSRYAETLPLADLAAAGGLAERTLTRLFRAATGLTRSATSNCSGSSAPST
ncbi:hypothetical protein [Micromonospora sp. WMMD1155]|uniref:hypothetical protein n=1 Tax=Micromonospora sp. WMMD1155 TaxID=3016094 RepID=UPI00249CCF63|nr:hypothetical protein [Micromonospora sp. WMMD1155]WFE52172.1 hypothetical protein O7617_18385 [Micromonospora sp. WMMD1155]